MEKILEETIRMALDVGFVCIKNLSEVIVDTTRILLIQQMPGFILKQLKA